MFLKYMSNFMPIGIIYYLIHKLIFFIYNFRLQKLEI